MKEYLRRSICEGGGLRGNHGFPQIDSLFLYDIDGIIISKMMRKNIRRTPYCATCEKAGEPESVFRGHFTKDAPGGNVVCPTIRGFKCKECGEMGHIANEKYCPVLRSYARSDKTVLKLRGRAERVLREVKDISAVNKFAAFASDSSSDSEDEVVAPVVVAPVVVAPAAVAPAPAANKSYRDILTKPVAVVPPPIVDTFSNFRVLYSNRIMKRRSWADDTSSDEGEDD